MKIIVLQSFVAIKNFLIKVIEKYKIYYKMHSKTYRNQFV